MLEPSALPAEVDPYLFAGERWFLDEVAEGVARVLAAAALDVRPFTELAHLADHSPHDAEATSRARDLVIELESADALAAWTEEIDHLIPIGALERVLGDRRVSLGFPEPRQIREGDVYWLARVADSTDAEPQLAVPGGLEQRLAELAELPPTERWSLALIGYRPYWIWDVTAAARHADKWRLDRAIRSSAGVGRG